LGKLGAIWPQPGQKKFSSHRKPEKKGGKTKGKWAPPLKKRKGFLWGWQKKKKLGWLGGGCGWTEKKNTQFGGERISFFGEIQGWWQKNVWGTTPGKSKGGGGAHTLPRRQKKQKEGGVVRPGGKGGGVKNFRH